MCSTPKYPTVYTQAEVIKSATKADAATQKANVKNRSGARGLASENIKTTNNGIEEDITSSKKKLLGE